MRREHDDTSLLSDMLDAAQKIRQFIATVRIPELIASLSPYFRHLEEWIETSAIL